MFLYIVLRNYIVFIYSKKLYKTIKLISFKIKKKKVNKSNHIQKY